MHHMKLVGRSQGFQPLEALLLKQVTEALLDLKGPATYSYKLYSFFVKDGKVSMLKNGQEFVFVENNRADLTVIQAHIHEAAILAGKQDVHR